MEPREVDIFKEKFEETVASIKKYVEQQKSGSEEHKRGDEVDLARTEQQALLELRLADRNMFFLKKMQSALDRIHCGSFGECEDCGAEISAQRLKARPTASLCINCKEEEERGEGQRMHKRRFSSISKSQFPKVLPMNA